MIEPGYRPPAVTTGKSIKLTLGGKPYELQFTEKGQIKTDSNGYQELYTLAHSTDAAASKAARNFLVIQTMAASDNLVERHKAVILGNYAVTNASLGILTSLAGGLVTVFSDTTTKSALGASAAVLNSSRSTVNEQVFLNQLATTIVSAIDQERKTLRAAIETKLARPTVDQPAGTAKKTEPTGTATAGTGTSSASPESTTAANEPATATTSPGAKASATDTGSTTTVAVAGYSIDQALLDVQAYHNAGSFAQGLVIVAAALSKQRETVTEIQTRITNLEAAYAKAKEENPIDPGTLQLLTQLNYLRAQLATAPTK